MANLHIYVDRVEKVKADIAKRKERIAKLRKFVEETEPYFVNLGIWDADIHYVPDDMDWSSATRRLSEKDSKLIWKLADTFSTIHDNEKKLKELDKKLEKAEAELAKQQEKDTHERKLFDNVPEELKELEHAIYEEFVERYHKLQDRVMELSRRHDAGEWTYREYQEQIRKSVGISMYEKLRFATDIEIQEWSKKDARGYILNLLDRVFKYTGRILDWQNVRITGPSLNGTIIGEDGAVYVETILAGGYNIQCLHNRVLVHPVQV